MSYEIGFYVPSLRGSKAFVPYPPEVVKGLEVLLSDLSNCSAVLARLDGLIGYLPNPFLLTENLIFMEAVTSSKIEGTRANFEDMFNSNVTPNILSNDINEVKNCAKAFRQGPQILKSAKSVMDLAKGMHQILMMNHPSVSGGEIKKSQNYTVKQDGSIFTYTPPHYLDQAIASFESFTMKNDDRIPELIRQAISHWIFEQIHPFPDGNGRVGRLLIPLLLQYKGVFNHPFAIISEAVEAHKNEYIYQFERLHQTKDWIPWCRFFLSMLNLNAHKNINRIEKLEALRLDYQKRVENKSKGSILPTIVQDLFKKPRFNSRELQSIYHLSPRGAYLIIQEMISLEIVKQENITKKRNVVYEAFDVLANIK